MQDERRHAVLQKDCTIFGMFEKNKQVVAWISEASTVYYCKSIFTETLLKSQHLFVAWSVCNKSGRFATDLLTKDGMSRNLGWGVLREITVRKTGRESETFQKSMENI